MLQGLHCRSNEALQEAKYVAGNRMVLILWIICSMKLVKRGS